MKRKLQDFFRSHLADTSDPLTETRQQDLLAAIEAEYQSWFLSTIIQEIEEIMSIDPSLPVKKILEIAAERIVLNLAADAATIRIFDPDSLRMTSFGSCGVADYERLASISVRDSIAGQVVQGRKSIAVPDILAHPLYQNKEIVKHWGFHSLLAVPLIMPVSRPSGNHLLGSMQIYYREQNRNFDKLEIAHAELLARRISFVLAKKKILDLEELNARKETIVNKIFVKLSRREGIKLKDLFVLLIPEIKELLPIQSCTLFSVSDDQRYINIVAAYPQDACYHDSIHSFTVSHHPYFQIAIQGVERPEDNEYERLSKSYILIKDPSRSTLISRQLQEFSARHHVHSILLVPLSVDDRVRHLLAFYATEQKQFFSDEEIKLLTFFGKEIMKASKLEFLGDVLHDIKNPAIALAGFANRARKLLESDDLESVREKLISYLDIMASESARMQDLAQAMSGEGREVVLDLAEVAGERYRIIKEVVGESKLRKVTLEQRTLEEGTYVSCSRFSLERVLDNLLGNAVRAVPATGGRVSMSCYREDGMACFSVRNTGEITSDRLKQMQAGTVRGRGLNIINRFVHANHGNIHLDVREGETKFVIKLPLVEPPGKWA